MFEINSNLKVTTERLYRTTIYHIKDFYKNPDEVYDYLYNQDRPLSDYDKEYDSFMDMGNILNDRKESIVEDIRLEVPTSDIFNVNMYLSGLCGESSAMSVALGNRTTFVDDLSHDYKNKFYWPHRDIGYNGILYLNKGITECGTNLYHPSILKTQKWKDDQSSPIIKVLNPWQPKGNYRVIKTFKSEYNTLVLFDGYKFPHGPNYDSDYYFKHSQSRCCQTFFFDRNRPVKKVAQSPWWKVWDRV